MKDKFISYYKYIIAFMVLICFIFLFFDCGRFFGSNGKTLLFTTGYQMIFGKVEEDYQILSFNTQGFLLLILMVCSIIVPFLKKIIGKYTKLLATLLLLLITILYFGLPSSVVHTTSFIYNNYQGLAIVYIGSSLLLLTFIYSIYVTYLEFKQKNNDQ